MPRCQQVVTVHRVTRDEVGYHSDAGTPPRLAIDSGESVLFETWDA